MRNTTQIDLAKAAGVTAAAVSMALKNSPRISEETKARIWKLADEMGYRPNAMATGLALYKQTQSAKTSYQATLAVITGHHDYNHLDVLPRYSRTVQGASKAASRLGFKLEPFWAFEPGMSAQRLHQIFQARNIQGILLLGVLPHEFSLPWEYYSVVNISATASRQFHTIDFSQTQASQILITRAIDLGYKRIGLFAARIKNIMNRSILMKTLALACQKTSLPYITPLQIKTKMSDDQQFDLFKRWLKKNKPDIIISLGKPETLAYLNTLGYSVPEDIGFMDMDVSTHDEHVSGCDAPWEVVGEHAVQLLIGQIYRNEKGIPEYKQNILLSPVWHPGKTICRRQS